MIPKHRPTHPGEFIKEDILEEFALTAQQLAEAVDVSEQTVNCLVNQQCDLNADMALRLARFTNTSPELWLNLQMAVDLWDAAHTPDAVKIEHIQPFAHQLA